MNTTDIEGCQRQMGSQKHEKRSGPRTLPVCGSVGKIFDGNRWVTERGNDGNPFEGNFFSIQKNYQSAFTFLLNMFRTTTGNGVYA